MSETISLSINMSEGESMRKAKLIKLHCESMPHLLETRSEAEENGKVLDVELLYTQSFFMGLVSGVLFETCLDDSPKVFSLKAQEYLSQVPKQITSLGTKIDYAKVNAILKSIYDEKNTQS